MGDPFHMNIEERRSPRRSERRRDPLARAPRRLDPRRAGRAHRHSPPAALRDIGYDRYLSFEVMAPSGDPMGIPEGAGPESFDADTKQAIEHLKALELELD